MHILLLKCPHVQIVFFEIHPPWQSGFSRVYSNSCCSCSFEAEIIKIIHTSHKMYSNKILNFQEITTIVNACTKKSGNLLNALRIYKLVTVVQGDQKAPFSIVSTLRCWRGRYSFPWIVPLYSWYLPFIAVCWTRRYQVPFLKSWVWRDLGLNPGPPDHWQTLYPLSQRKKGYIVNQIDMFFLQLPSDGLNRTSTVLQQRWLWL